MKYYLLKKLDLELEEIQKADFFKWISENDEDYIYIRYNPQTGHISSLDDISGYWFHVLRGELHWAIQTKEMDAIEHFHRLSDSSYASALWGYDTSVKDNKKHDLLTVLKDYQDSMVSSREF